VTDANGTGVVEAFAVVAVVVAVVVAGSGLRVGKNAANGLNQMGTLP
jgi:hypothetical protein